MSSKQEKLVSVIIPIHNRIALFESTIASVLSQSYLNLEIIIINDGSNVTETKLLSQIIEVNQALFPDIDFKYCYINGRGAPTARNIGFTMSTGHFIQFLDSDDLLLPNKIESQLAILENDSSLDLAYSKAQFVDENLTKKEEFWGRALTGNYYDYFFFSWQTMCPLYRRSAIEKFGLWDESLKINQDWEFSIRYIVLGAKVHFVDEVQSFFVQHKQGNIGDSKMSLKKINGKFDSTNKVFLLLIEKNKMNKELKHLFVKRWIYVISVTSVLKGKNVLNQQFLFLKKQLPFALYYLILPLKIKPIASLFLSIYNRFVLNK